MARAVRHCVGAGRTNACPAHVSPLAPPPPLSPPPPPEKSPPVSLLPKLVSKPRLPPVSGLLQSGSDSSIGKALATQGRQRSFWFKCSRGPPSAAHTTLIREFRAGVDREVGSV